ncbi:MAG: DUF814 domain-containing protein [Epsilonproteobacteria bacterium]|nr:DUF814 domain-containing protein [Campylobacterota bacterium]
MKRYQLLQIADYIKRFKKIDKAFRVDDTVIKMVFDKGESLFFDMKKGESYIFKKDDYKTAKEYEAPFDVVLRKRCNASFIRSVEVLPDNKVLRFEIEQRKSYKAVKSFLQLEFTGRHTNFIILDEKMTILEALRHIDASVSYRVIQNGLKLPDLPPFKINEKYENIEDIESFLYEEYKKREQKRLLIAINQKLIEIQKKIDKLQKIKNSLKKPQELLKKSDTYQKEAELILANLHNIKSYQKGVFLKDFEGNEVNISFPNEAKTPADAANILFSTSKKLRQKAKNIHIEEENLISKIEYLKKLQEIVKNTKSIDELKLYFPKKSKSKKKSHDFDGVENFYYNGYKISLGKNEKANEYLLKKAKMNDLWLHLKDIPSTHVIIRSDKKEVPKEVVEFAAKLCVKFSTSKKGSFLVDYAKRRDVRIVSGAKVNYVNYKTISVSV